MPRPPLQRAAWFALAYVLLSVVWIAGSDALLHAWITDHAVLRQAQTWKGAAFVLITGGLLFVLLYRLFRHDAHLLRRYARQRSDVQMLNQFRESVIDNASIWINVLDPQARVVLWNKAAEQISGYSRDEVIGRSDIWEQLYPDRDYRESVTAKVSEILAQGVEVENLETRIRCRDGQEKIVSWNSRRFFSEDNALGSIAIGRDVTDRKQMQQMLRARDRQLAILMANVPGMVYRRRNNTDWTLRFVSSGCLGLTGYTADDLVENRGMSYASLVHPEDRERVQDETHRALNENQAFTLEYRIRHRSGQHRWVWEQGRAVQADDGPHLEGIIVNITDRKRVEHQLEQLAVQDPLTGLRNRRELEITLQDAVEQAESARRPLALLWIDIDDFKRINDVHGHLAGDEVLRQVSRVIRDHLRSDDMAARYGGDEIVVALPGMDAQAATRIAETLQQAVRALRLRLPGGEPIAITLSIGVAAVPEHVATAEQLAEAADRAMYRAKEAGRNQICNALPMPPPTPHADSEVRSPG
ncbi:sensor domain-containing diguanylate cyclase [Oleiagrimonas soli]|uniref:Diguanylate cyclase (GGDEF)-like protein/PAS domain S-box-containing protein n=1 Tax=Oleiagrimonas soli TaxID=1543381 RepID=A0A841KIR5_9GAMM|nr:diguanylate cyclase [Oleiagrimonas soli]MBB6184955.1 diguanylate cyclase (GGDEF)-like protein/PAS domain S-box-containing protein [Oleiagrimonas soli]